MGHMVLPGVPRDRDHVLDMQGSPRDMESAVMMQSDPNPWMIEVSHPLGSMEILHG